MEKNLFSELNVEKIFFISQKQKERVENINYLKSILDFECEIIESVKHNFANKSLSLTNKKILEENKDFNILIFEDDAFTTLTIEEIKNRFSLFKKTNCDFDILLLGSDPQLYKNNTKNFIFVKEYQDTHAVFYPKKTIPKLLPYLADIKDNDYFDRYLSDISIKLNLKVACFFPSIFTQQPFNSSIDKCFKIKYDRDFNNFKELDLGMIDIKDFIAWPESKVTYMVNDNFKQESCDLRIRVINYFTGVIHYDYSYRINKNANFYSQWTSKNNNDACDYWVEFYLNNEIVFKKIFSRRILISIPSSGIGDTLCATPAIKKIFKAENQLIDVITHHPEVFKNNEFVYRIYDINTYQNNKDDSYNKLLAAYDRKFTTFKYCGAKDNEKIQKKHASFDLRRLHAADLGFDLLPEEMSCMFNPDEISFVLPKEKYIVLNPQITWGARSWSKNNWNVLIKMLNDKNIKMCLIGKTGFADTVNSKGFFDVEGDFMDYRDKLSLSDTYHLIKNALCIVTMDSGIMHLAGCSDCFIFQLGSSIHPYYRSPYRNGSREYKYEYIIGDCEIHCASNLKYYKKVHNSFNEIPFLPSCLENKKQFDCHPSPEKVAFKILKLIDENTICNN